MVEALNRLDGREARGRILTGHSVPEVQYGNNWHMFDASLITYFPKPGGGDVAAVDDISAAVKGWYDKNPTVRGNDKKLTDVMRENGWTGWKAKGPELLSQCPFYDLGWFPAATHGWNATMVEYDRKCEEYEYGYHVGHKALLLVAAGRIDRARGGQSRPARQHAGKQGLGRPESPRQEHDLVYTKKFMPGYNGGMVANGYHRYEPDLASLATSAESFVNLAAGGSPKLHLKEGGKPATAVVALTSPYVYLGGRVKVKALRKAEGRPGSSFPFDEPRPQLRTALEGGESRRQRSHHRPQGPHPSPLRLLAEDRAGIGKPPTVPASIGCRSRTISSTRRERCPGSARGATRSRSPSMATTTPSTSPAGSARMPIACRIMPPDAKFTKQETTASLGVTFDNLNVVDGACWWKGGVGTMTVPIETPGPMVAGTFSAQYRARGDKDLIQVSASYDGGKTWDDVTKLAGPTPGKSGYHRFTPKKDATKALLRFAMTGNNTVGLLSFRVDVTYVDPRTTAKPAPFFVTHRWKENGKPMEKRMKVESLPMKYTIDAAGEVEMVSVTY